VTIEQVDIDSAVTAVVAAAGADDSAAPGEDVDERGVDAHHAVVNDKKTNLTVTTLLARLAAGVRG
jgi:hypothetical protein